MVGIFARAASGRVAAAPPRTAIKSCGKHLGQHPDDMRGALLERKPGELSEASGRRSRIAVA